MILVRYSPWYGDDSDVSVGIIPSFPSSEACRQYSMYVEQENGQKLRGSKEERQSRGGARQDKPSRGHILGTDVVPS